MAGKDLAAAPAVRRLALAYPAFQFQSLVREKIAVQVLEQYITEVQDFLNDQQGQFFPLPVLTRYINRSRRRIAAASGCLRVVPPGTQTHPNQEIYAFSDWIAVCQGIMPGIESILACRSLAVSIGSQGWKPVWRRVPWTDFQARFRIYNGMYYGTTSEPGWYAQFGLGPAGALYLAPIPSQRNLMEVDLSLIPRPLITDDDIEPIPYPWTDAVSYWAATLCLLQQQRREDAQAMATLFNTDMPFAASVVCPQMIVNPYGATLRSA